MIIKINNRLQEHEKIVTQYHDKSQILIFRNAAVFLMGKHQRVTAGKLFL